MSDRSKWTMEALLSARRGAVDMIADLDAELHRRGVRPIQLVVGRPRDVAEAVTRALSSGPKSAKEIQRATGHTSWHAVHQMLSKMTLAGELRRVGRGVYALPACDS